MMNKIDYYKKKMNLSYADIAKIVGLSPTYIHLLAKNHRKNPSLEVATAIAEVFNKKVDQVFIKDEE